ncbi:MAG TPA: GTP 3',8-cyclase MoaA [Chthoniobacterales bacterium]
MHDRFGHHVTYLRISITDRCNERCLYCMPQDQQEWLPHADILTFEEITRLTAIFSTLGVDKIRLTGGEPLTRRNVLGLFEMLSRLDGIREIGVSTNASLLSHQVKTGGGTVADHLRRCRVDSVNISLDSLNPETFRQITGRDYLGQTLEGIAAAQQAGIPKIKLNTVLLKGRNEHELADLAEFAGREGLLLRFIELMPVSQTEVLDEDTFFPIAAARRQLEAHFGPLIPDPDFRTNGPATYYQVPGTGQRLGFIGAMTNLHFCETCNKMRLTCDGKIRPCLGSHLEFDIREPLRAGASDAELRRLILAVVASKPEQHGFRLNYQPGRKMVAIGG